MRLGQTGKRRRERGLTLLEVIVAAGLLGAFTVVGARPIQQAMMAANAAGDRAAALRYAAAGIELARSRTIDNWDNSNGNMGIPQAEQTTYYDTARHLRLDRSITAQPLLVNPANPGEKWTWSITSVVTWTRDGRSASQGAKVTLASRQSRWLIRNNADQSRGAAGKVYK